jgi:hypothetical protein
VPNHHALLRYTFRLYFVPPPAPPSNLPPDYWVQELQTHAKDAPAALSHTGLPAIDPQDIDPNAQAWKIMYVVTEWASLDGRSYPYQHQTSG